MLTKLFYIYAISDLYDITSYSRIKSSIDHKFPHVTVLSGDFINPNPYSGFDYGQTVIDAIKLTPIDIVSFGNHEFDLDVKDVYPVIEKDNYTTYLSSNIKIPNSVTYHIIEHGKLKIGFIGICQNIFYAKNTIDFQDIYESVKINIEWLKFKKVTHIIAMTHLENEDDKLLLELFPEINLILAGHNHTMDVISYMNRTIVRTGENANFLAKVIFYDNLEFNVQMIDISQKPCSSDFTKLIEKSDKMINSLNDKILYNLSEKFSTINHRKEQNKFMIKFCSMIQRYFNSDIAILNAGIFRLKKEFEHYFTYSDFTIAFPYNDFFVKIKMLGKDLLAGLKYSNTKYYDDGGYLHYNNITIFENKVYEVSTSTLILAGIDANPYFLKYFSGNLYDGIPLKTILLSYSNFTI